MIGKTISHYKVVKRIGSGGMGVVFKAEDSKLNRPVALKFLPPSFATDPNIKERFIHEAQAASALQHSNICTIHEINETEDGQMYFAMEYYQGNTLKELLEKGRMNIDEAVNIVLQIARGLGAAHQKGIIHRDIKPANIIVTDKGEVKILDFGLSKVKGQTKLTKSGSTLGTITHMSPEQAQGQKVDHRSDLWSLGVILYEMVAGTLPFEGEYDQAIIYSIINDQPESLKKNRPEAPENLVRIMEKLLLKKPDLRYQSAEELERDLKSIRKTTQIELKTDKFDLKYLRIKKKYLMGLILFIIATITVGIIFKSDFFQYEIRNKDTSVIVPTKIKDVIGVRKIRYDEGVFVEYAHMLESTLKASLTATGTCEIIDQFELENELGADSKDPLQKDDIINLRSKLNLDGLIVGNLFRSVTKGHIFSVEYYNTEDGSIQGTYNIQIDESTEKTLGKNLMGLAYQLTGKKTSHLKVSSEYVVLNNKAVSYFKSIQAADSVNQINLPELSELFKIEVNEASQLKSEGKISLHDLLLQMEGDISFETFIKCAYSAGKSGITNFRLSSFDLKDPSSMFSFSSTAEAEEGSYPIETPDNKNRLGLKLAITSDGLTLATNEAVLAGDVSETPTVPIEKDNEYDWRKLSDILYELKLSIKEKRYSDENAIIITASRKTEFKTILYACKTVGYKNMLDGTEIELFPLMNFGIVVGGSVTFENEYIEAYKTGDFEQARKSIEPVINSPDPYLKLWYYIILKKAKQKDKAQNFITDISKRILNNQWVETIVDYYAGSISEENLFKATNDTNQVRNKEKKCEACYYVGMSHLFMGDRKTAKDFFQRCLDYNLESFYETKLSRIELNQLFQN